MKLHVTSLSKLPDQREDLLPRILALPFGQSERERLCSIRSGQYLRQSLGAREALWHLTKSAPLTMSRNEGEKPILEGKNAPLFSLTHDAHLAAAVISKPDEGCVGVDLETIRPMTRRDAIAKRLFSEEDLARMSHATDPDREFFILWTAKEAAVKCTGKGLSAISERAEEHLFLYRFAIRHPNGEAILTVASTKPTTISLSHDEGVEICPIA